VRGKGGGKGRGKRGGDVVFDSPFPIFLRSLGSGVQKSEKRMREKKKGEGRGRRSKSRYLLLLFSLYIFSTNIRRKKGGSRKERQKREERNQHIRPLVIVPGFLQCGRTAPNVT